jgi:uncharacterized membrane protein
MTFLAFSPVFAQIQEWNTDVTQGGCLVDGVPTLGCLEIIFGNILFMASAFVLLILFIMLIVGGFNYLTSLGNTEKVKKAQGTIKFAIIGFALFLLSYLILWTIDVLFLGGQGNILRFEI